MDDTLETAWSEWKLVKDFQWSWFVTATFPLPTSRDCASKKWSLVCNELAKDVLPARQARRKGLPWLRAVEQTNDSHHIHAVVSGVSADAIRAKWKELVSSGANIQIKPYDPKLCGIAYLVKESDVEFSRYFTIGLLPT